VKVAIAALALALSLVVSSCAVGCACSTPVFGVTVFAAASLKDALDEITTTYEAARPDVKLTISAGSSAALRTQIEQGGPATLFLSADTANPQALVDAGLTDGPARPFATNLLTIIVPAGNPAGITSPADLARPGMRIIAAGDDVPITRYATQVVEKLAALPGYAVGFAATYGGNIVSREDNVGAVVSKIQLGEGDAAMVYVTDAQSDTVDQVEIPVQANVVATYAGVVVRREGLEDQSRQLLDWIRSPTGQQILAARGFAPAP
jgi:molybdate transport system substrate-binding protein